MSLLGDAPVWLSAGERDVPANPAWLAPAERERAAAMRFTKRRGDYLLGRYTGKTAIARALELGLDASALRSIEIRNRATGPERGAPEVFIDGSRADVEISITDRAGWGVCMLRPPGLRVGCDLELVEMRSEAFVADYLTAPERDFVEAGPSDPERWLRANLIWSAKESVLKVLRTGLRRDTRSVDVQILGATEPERWRAFCASTPEGRVFSGWWRRYGAFLLTAAVERATGVPRALVDPPRLERASPSHTWLRAPAAHAPAAEPRPR